MKIKPNIEPVTEAMIKAILARKHSLDVWAESVKTGETWFKSKSLGIIDFWVMERSWAHPNFTAYEIKISRSDFRSDHKWRKYLPYCNRLFFACPPRLIRPEEVEDPAGLIYCYPDTMVTRIVKIPKWRDGIPPPELFMYILMSKGSHLEGLRMQLRIDRLRGKCHSLMREIRRLKDEIGHETRISQRVQIQSQ